MDSYFSLRVKDQLMSKDKQPMTVKGKALLDAETKQLLQEERPRIIKAIEEARAHGDLSENADYDAAKEKQGFIEARIGEIQSKLAMAEVIDPSSINSKTVVFGATVTVNDLDSEKEITYQIVGEDEANVKEGRISVFSPLARALIGKKEGSIIDFKSPKGEKEYEVIKLEYK